MPRFQSRLFNWIDRSLPVQLGRNVRRSLDQKIQQLTGLPRQELPRLLAYQVAKAALYPVYLIASSVKRTFPALDRSKAKDGEKLRSQPDSVLPLRPLAKFLNWIDRTKINLDRNIAAIVKRQPDRLATSDSSELESKLIANRLFAEIWRQQVDQGQSSQNSNSLKESNGLAENVALGKNSRFEQLRSLIEAAIAYFFGNQLNIQNENLASSEQDSELLGTESAEALPDDPNLQRRRVNSANSSKSGALKENSSLVESNNLERLRDLIAAAIDYFIGKKELDGDRDLNVDNLGGIQSDLLSGNLIDKLQTSSESSPNRDQNLDSENSDALQIDNQFERLQKLIEDAIAYFFGKQRSQPTLDETSDITETSSLTMEDMFGNDNGPWPMSAEHESIAFSKSPDRTAIHSSGELQNFETTTTQISQDRLDGSLVFEEDFLGVQQQSSETESDRPLRAWIEANATILGYVYNPVMTVVLWVDAIVLKIEDLIINFWQGLLNFPKRLIHFIRHGKKY